MKPRRAAKPFPVLAVVALTCCARSAVGQSAAVDQYIRAEMKRLHIPGLSLVVAKNGVVVKRANYGLASVELQVPVSSSTVFHIASTTKSITAVAVLLLVADGRLKTKDSVTRLLPGLPPHWSGVTLGHLLSHTSGLPDVLAVPGLGPVLFVSRKEALDSLPHLPLLAAPGERWMYNQTNYLLLQDIVEKISGQSFVQFVRSRVFEPLGMRASVFGTRTVTPHYATHYQAGDSGKLERFVNDVGAIPFLYAAGGVATSAADLFRFAEALRRHELLPAALLNEMWTPFMRNDGTTTITLGPFTIEYGYGFVIDRRRGHRSVGHSGGGTAAFRVFLDDPLTVVVLHNGRTPNPDELVLGVAAKYVPALGRSPGDS